MRYFIASSNLSVINNQKVRETVWSIDKWNIVYCGNIRKYKLSYATQQLTYLLDQTYYIEITKEQLEKSILIGDLEWLRK